MKICRICNEEKLISEFYKHSGMKDGYINNCKSCHNKRSVEWTATNKERVNENNRKRAKQQSVKEARKKRYTSEVGRLKAREAMRRYREKRPMVEIAHRFVRLAIQKGLIKKESECSLCGSQNIIEAHHNDYTKPDVVQWLCKVCHEDWHRFNTPIYTENKKEQA